MLPSAMRLGSEDQPDATTAGVADGVGAATEELDATTEELDATIRSELDRVESYEIERQDGPPQISVVDPAQLFRQKGQHGSSA